MQPLSRYPGYARFEKQLSRIEILLHNGASEVSPANYLYNNDMRTPLFLLEGLARIYRKIHNRKRFEKLLKWFKEAEDALGAIDYYESFGDWAQ